MTRRVRFPRLASWAAVACLAACAHGPGPGGAPTASADRDAGRAAMVDARQRAAIDDEKAGDWSAAVAQWHVALLLAPDDRVLARHFDAARASQQRAAADAWRGAQAARARGDLDEAARSALRTLAIDPDHGEAGALLRDAEGRKMARIQAQRAARVRRDETIASEGATTRVMEAARTTEADLALNRFSTDNEAGLTDLQRYANARPTDAAGRRRLARAVLEAARKAESEGNAERALTLYRQVPALSGGDLDGVDAKVAALGRSLAADYNTRAQRASATDLSQAIPLWEKALAFDPKNANIALELERARQMQRKLDRLQAPDKTR